MVDNSQGDGSVELKLDGQRYGYWKNLSVSDSVDDLCTTVSMQCVRPGFGGSIVGVNTLAELLIDGELVTTLRPDRQRRRVTKDSNIVSINARSRARELVDCQYSKTLSGLTLGEIAKRICDTFKVPLNVVGKTAVVPHFSMQCEQPSNALINAARAANKLLYPLPDGGLILTDPTDDEPVATLVYGEHFTQYDLVDEYQLRFSEYRVKSFDYSAGAAMKGGIKDDEFDFFRPMHVVADRHGNGQGACDRSAQLQYSRRLARAHRIDLELPGWKHSGGVWRVNTRVRVVIPHEGVDDVLMIGQRDLKHDEKGGKVSTLQVMRREAFMGVAPKKQKRASGVSK